MRGEFNSDERRWQAVLQRNPLADGKFVYGVTTTYSEIARMIGKPSAARAVACACASNRIAVLVPCHRIVRSDGKLGGYRWGLDRKKRLLERESSDGEE